VHDAARPFATPELFARVIARARATGAAIAALPCTDTVKRSEAGATAIRATLDRRELWLAQTPQVFAPQVLLRAYEAAGARASAFTDEASLVEATGHPVELVPG